MQPNQRQINNVPQRTLLSLWISSTHGCAAARTLIRFTSLPSLSLSPRLIHFFSYVCLLRFWDVRNSSFFQGILWSFAPSLHLPHPSPLSAPYHIQRSAAFLFPTLLPPFFFSFRTLIPFSHHLSLSSVWLEHMYNAWWWESCEETCLCQ